MLIHKLVRELLDAPKAECRFLTVSSVAAASSFSIMFKARAVNVKRVTGSLASHGTCSINTPSDRGVCTVHVGDPVERDMKRETVSNA